MPRRVISAREALKYHSWAIGLMESRNPGPANPRNHNAVMGCLREAGFSFETVVHHLLGPRCLHLRFRPAEEHPRVRDTRVDRQLADS